MCHFVFHYSFFVTQKSFYKTHNSYIYNTEKLYKNYLLSKTYTMVNGIDRFLIAVKRMERRYRDEGKK